MAFWGTGLYSNDLSLDIQDDIIELFHKGKSAEEITEELLNQWHYLMDKPYDAPLFWFVLADNLWKRGMLTEYVKKQALYWIDNNGDVERWENNVPKSAKQRIKVLNQLKERILSPQPPKKKPRIETLYKCEWKIGDVFAYKLKSEKAFEMGFENRYFLIQKIDEGTYYPGHIIPIVYVKITNDNILPKTVEEFDSLEYIQVWSDKPVARFWPINGADPIGDIFNKAQIDYQFDEYGFLPQFRSRLINTSKRIIPKDLIYIGNFIDSKPPKIEFVPDKVNIDSLYWKIRDRTFETEMLKKYYNYNLRNLGIYKIN